MKQYLDLLKAIKETGDYKEPARENMPGTYSLFGYQFRHNLEDGFPALTTKKLYWKGVVIELLWFLSGNTNIKFLDNYGVRKMWHQNAYNYYVKIASRNDAEAQNYIMQENPDGSYRMFTFEEFCDIIKEYHETDLPYYEEYTLGDCAIQYGSLWRRFGESAKDVKKKRNPNFQENIKFPLIEENKKSNSKFVGLKLKTKQGYDIKVIDFDGINNFKVQFLHSGLCINTKSRNFSNIEYPYFKSVMNIACIGLDKNNLDKKIRAKLYNSWRQMLGRCYDTNNISYYLYGEKDIYVDNRWLCFEYFLDDIICLEGWDKKLINWNKYHLDKDLKGGKCYSKNNCVWLNTSINCAKPTRTIYYKLRNIKTGEIIKTNNLSVLNKLFGIKSIKSHGYQLKNGILKTIGGWEIIEIYDVKKEYTDQIKDLIHGLKTNPTGRRHIITAWNPATLNDMALNACHCMAQWNCRTLTARERHKIYNPKGDYGTCYQYTEEDMQKLDELKVPKYKLDCQMYQRSVDVPTGLPLNISSYALLTHIFSKICNMIPGEMIYSLGDAHIYENQLEGVEEQLKRDLNKYKLPKLNLDGGSLQTTHWKNLDLDCLIDVLIKEWDKIFILENYESYPTISFILNTGIKK